MSTALIILLLVAVYIIFIGWVTYWLYPGSERRASMQPIQRIAPEPLWKTETVYAPEPKPEESTRPLCKKDTANLTKKQAAKRSWYLRNRERILRESQQKRDAAKVTLSGAEQAASKPTYGSRALR